MHLHNYEPLQISIRLDFHINKNGITSRAGSLPCIKDMQCASVTPSLLIVHYMFKWLLLDALKERSYQKRNIKRAVTHPTQEKWHLAENN